jgi:5S rRNA maturation endonuclease (ribonuclease M5)
MLLDDLLKELETLKNSKKVILVEGKKDQLVLEKFGIKSITLKKPLFSVVETIEKECIILTDLDKEGRRLYSILRKNLEKRKVKIDNRFRVFLIKRTKLKQIEGLDTYIKNLQKP